MSGHTLYTEWICCEAGHLLYEGKPVKIKDGFFTSDPDGGPNSDIFIIQLKNKKNVGLSNPKVDWIELVRRYDKYRRISIQSR